MGFAGGVGWVGIDGAGDSDARAWPWAGNLWIRHDKADQRGGRLGGAMNILGQSLKLYGLGWHWDNTMGADTIRCSCRLSTAAAGHQKQHAEQAAGLSCNNIMVTGTILQRRLGQWLVFLWTKISGTMTC